MNNKVLIVLILVGVLIMSEKESTKLNMSNDIRFNKAVTFLLGIEGGYVNDKYDEGGETKYGISKESFPNEDIPNLTLERAKELYYRYYWLRTGADKTKSYPLAYVLFDTAVNHGIYYAKQLAVRGNYNIQKC